MAFCLSLFFPMYAPIFPLTFAFGAFLCKQPEDKSSYPDAYGEGKYNHDCQREPVNQVGTEGVILEPVHNNDTMPQWALVCGAIPGVKLR